MKRIWKFAGAVALLAIAAGCVYGLMSTLGPTNRAVLAMSFRIGYTVVGVVCLGGTIILIAECFRK